MYSPRDYRRFLSAHLQLLSGLCRLTSQLVNDSIVQFYSSSFVTAQLLPPTIFSSRIALLIQASLSNANTTFTRLLSLFRMINHGNAIVSAYGTNFQYLAPWYDDEGKPVVAEPILYDDDCSCASDEKCTIEAAFMRIDSSENITIKGLKMGCTPSETLLASTLECFYDSTCINLLQQHTYNITFPASFPLATINTRFSVNSTIGQLVEEIFIEKWLTSTSYLGYFNECSPDLCSYAYVEQVNLLYTVTFLLGLYGGLTFFLKVDVSQPSVSYRHNLSALEETKA